MKFQLDKKCFPIFSVSDQVPVNMDHLVQKGYDQEYAVGPHGNMLIQHKQIGRYHSAIYYVEAIKAFQFYCCHTQPFAILVTTFAIPTSINIAYESFYTIDQNSIALLGVGPLPAKVYLEVIPPRLCVWIISLEMSHVPSLDEVSLMHKEVELLRPNINLNPVMPHSIRVPFTAYP